MEVSSRSSTTSREHPQAHRPNGTGEPHLGTGSRGSRAFGEARNLCFSAHRASLLASRTRSTRPPKNLLAAVEDVCPQSRSLHRRMRFSSRGDRSVPNSLCVPPDGSWDAAARALQRHCAPDGRVDLAAVSEAIPSDHSYRFVIHDRDSIFAEEVDGQLQAFGLRVLRTPARAPQANAYCERLVGTVRRECLDFMIPLNERQLGRILAELGHSLQPRPTPCKPGTGDS